MARQLRWWIAATLIACSGIGLAYLPPRGARPEHERLRTGGPQPTAARQREWALAAQWRTADLSLRLREYRQRLAPELARRRETDEAGPALLIEAPDSVPAPVRQILRAGLDTVWRHLGLDATKVSVGVIIFFSPTGTPREGAYTPAYLLPDSTDRNTCLALLPAGRSPLLLKRQVLRWKPSARLQAWLKNGLGPCAFYAAYGAPGKPVRRWMARREYDLATFPDWDRGPLPHQEAGFLIESRTRRWDWPSVYRFPPRAVACLAGRPAACRAAVLEGADDYIDDSLPRIVTTELWWWRGVRLVDGDRYLADVARDVGHARFLRLWNSSLPVETALAAALKMPVGEWTERWERRFAPTLPLGATVPFSAAVLGMLLGGAAVASVVVAVSRREIR